MVYCALFLVAVTWAGLIFVRPFLWAWLRREPRVNAVGHASGGFSLFYALLLGLLSVSVYQNSERVNQLVNLEAASIASLYRGFSSYPEPLRSELEFLLRDYTLYVINEDFPCPSPGRDHCGSNRLQLITRRLAEYEPASRSRELLHSEVFRGFSDISTARHQRLAAVDTRIPGVLWYCRHWCCHHRDAALDARHAFLLPSTAGRHRLCSSA
ncbi:MAG: hypothetical protein R3C69_13975 [Geminicoccaceae bacterium]